MDILKHILAIVLTVVMTATIAIAAANGKDTKTWYRCHSEAETDAQKSACWQTYMTAIAPRI